MGFNPYDPNRQDIKQTKEPIPYPAASTLEKKQNSFLIETFQWMVPEFSVQPTDGKTVKIKGKAIPRETVSLNNKKYIDEELKMAARTWIDTPITSNHAKWSDKKNQLGKVNWMEYDPADGSMEYVAEVWNPEMAAELKLYAKDPKNAKISGVSIEADFLKIACSVCKQKFLSEAEWHNHMATVEGLKDLPLEPHGIRGRALSIVTGKERAGIVGNTLEVIETVNGYKKLCETILKEKGISEHLIVATSTTGPAMTQTVIEPTKPNQTTIEQDNEANDRKLLQNMPEPYKSAYQRQWSRDEALIQEWKQALENTPQFQEQQRLIKETRDIQETKLKEATTKIAELEQQKNADAQAAKEIQEQLRVSKETYEAEFKKKNELVEALTAERDSAAEIASDAIAQAKQLMEKNEALTKGIPELVSTHAKTYEELRQQLKTQTDLSEKLQAKNIEQQRKIVEYENQLDKRQPTFKANAKIVVEHREAISSFNPYSYDRTA